MRFTVLLLALFLVSCGDKALNVPKSVATKEQKAKVEEALSILQAEFDELGVKVNVRKYPVIVRHDKKALGPMGVCTEKGSKKYITLNSNLFDDSSVVNGDSPEESLIISVLLHEIGHCYFKREHLKEKCVSDPEGFAIFPEIGLDEDGETYQLKYNSIPVSVMIPTMTFPRALRKYYVAEIAKKDSLQSLEDVRKYSDYLFFSNSDPRPAIQAKKWVQYFSCRN